MMSENEAGTSERREKLEDLLKRIGREPASEWGFKTEGEKMLWVFGKMAEGLKTRAETAFENAKKKINEKKKVRQAAKHAPEAKA
jgi:hypothetical protein